MKTKQPELNKITALYERLSRDDEESTPMHRTITPAPLTVKQRTK